MENNDNGITHALIQDILNQVNLALNIKDAEIDKVLEMYINIICNKILIKTNRRIFVPKLKYAVIGLVQDAYILYLSNLKAINDIDSSTNSIQSMSEAGRSVSFGATNVSNDLANRLNLIANKQLEENELLINRFKLLYKT